VTDLREKQNENASDLMIVTLKSVSNEIRNSLRAMLLLKVRPRTRNQVVDQTTDASIAIGFMQKL
jgi:hypothetical protein